MRVPILFKKIIIGIEELNITTKKKHKIMQPALKVLIEYSLLLNEAITIKII